MSIYDTGTASLASNGQVTGVGTQWTMPLTLIRVGATLIFKTEPLQIYTISEITSDTSMSVYNPNGETVPFGTGYAILAHDGISVQGLAQDVAETLRYYQSRETEIADAVDAFNSFDSVDFNSKVTQVNTQHGDIVSIGSQVSADADQVSSDKDSTAAIAISAANSQNAAAISAQEAADYAASLNTSNLLRKDLSLSDLTDKHLARQNLDVYSKDELGEVSSFSKIGSANYADIRAYAGDDYAISCYGRENFSDNSFGIFQRDDADTSSQDNDGTILVDSLGRRWKRSYTGPVDARWFGVKADGVTDDTLAANKATSTLQDVIFPSGVILISSPILFGTQNIRGASTYPNQSYGTIIQCTGDHSGFEHFPTGYQPGGSIANFWINYQTGKPSTDSGFSRGIDFGTRDESIDPLTGGVTNFKVENVIVRGAYYGFYDVTSAYLMEYVNCWAWDCIQGFRKDYGTTVKYSTCYSLDCYASWALKYCHVATFVNCAYDGTSNFGNLTPFIATQCPGLTITGMQHESSKVNVNGGSDFVLVDCNSANISGFSIPSWRNQNPQGTEGYLFRFSNSDVDISGINLSGFVSGGTSDVISDGANSYVILAQDGSNVRVSASNLPVVAGSQYSYSLSASADSRIDHTSNCNVGGLVNGMVFTNGLSRPSYVDYSISLAANGGMAFLGSISVPGVKYGDFICVDSNSGLSGVDILASRAGGGVGSVNVFLVNHNTSPVDVSGQIAVRFMRP
jgi:hypothetical protein